MPRMRNSLRPRHGTPCVVTPRGALAANSERRGLVAKDSPVRSESPLRPTWLRALGLAAFSIGLSVYAWKSMIAAYPHPSNGDGTMYQKILEAGRVSLVRYHEFPFWNPYECGGYPLWDNPQGFAGAPLLWLVLFVNSTATIYVWVIAHVALGFASMWLFARHEVRLSRVAAFVAAGAWAYSGFHQQHYSGGHFTFVPWVLFPLALLLWRRAEHDLRCAVGLGALAAWMFYEGAVYPLPHLVLLLAAETLTRVWPARRLPSIVRAGLLAGVVAFAIAAARLLPVLDQLRQHSRPALNDGDFLTGSTLKAMFLARQHGRDVFGQQYVWTEWGTYLGPIVLTLGLIGIVTGGVQAAWMAGLLGFAFVLMCGHFAKWAPWSLLTAHVPPFREMRVPSRFRATVSLFLAAYAGIAVDRLLAAAQRFVPSRAWSSATQTLVVAIALLGVGDIIGVGIDTIPQFFTTAPLTAPQPAAHFYYGGPGLASFLDQPAQNRGELSCYDEWGFGQGSHLWEGDVSQARAIDDSATVETASRTQNTFSIDGVAKRRGALVLLNTVYDDDWKTTVGKTVKVSNQLAIELPEEGRFHLRAYARPRTFVVGVILTVLGIAGTVGFFVWDARRRRRNRQSLAV